MISGVSGYVARQLDSRDIMRSRENCGVVRSHENPFS